jgi:hypothetical protein
MMNSRGDRDQPHYRILLRPTVISSQPSHEGCYALRRSTLHNEVGGCAKPRFVTWARDRHICYAKY